MNRRNHKRTNHPSYRHQPHRLHFRRQVTPKQTQLPLSSNSVTNNIENVFEEVDALRVLDEEIEKTAAQEFNLPVKSIFSKPNRKKTRKEKKWASREAEIDSLIERKKYNSLQLLLHPYQSMLNEHSEDIPANIFVGLFRMIVKWLILGFFIGEEVRRIVETEAFSFMRIEYPHVISLTIRLTLLFTAAECAMYVCHCFLSLFTKKRISLHRLITAGSMLYLWEIIGFLISACVGIMYDPIIGLLVAFAVTLMAMMLKNQAMIDKSRLPHELVTFVSVCIVFVAAYFVLKYLNVSEKQIIEIYIKQHL